MQVAARYHHERDITKRGFLSQDLNQVVDIVMLANLLVHALKFGFSGHTQIAGAPNDLLDRLMLDPQRDMGNLLKKIRANLETASDFIKLIASGG